MGEIETDVVNGREFRASMRASQKLHLALADPQVGLEWTRFRGQDRGLGG
jgi:hypothetical protein